MGISPKLANSSVIIELLPLSGYKYEALIYVSVKKIISEFELNLLGQLEKIRFSGVLVTRYENDLQKVTIEIDTDGDWKYQIFEGDKLNDIGKIIFGEMGKEKNPYITISLRGGKELNNKICDMLNRQKLYSGQPLYIGFNLDTKAINQQLIAKDLLGFNEEFVEHLKILSMSIGQINDLQAFK